MEVVSSSAPLTKGEKSIPGPAAGRSRKRRNICIGVSFAVIGFVLLVIILALTVFKAKRPVTTVNSVTLVDLAVSLDGERLAVDINITLIANISVKNPNKVGFKSTDSIALLNYRGATVGEALIPAERIPADRTTQMNITLTIMADRLISQPRLFLDVTSGSLPLNTYTRIPGKVTILGIFKLHVVSTASCDITVDISNKSVGDQQCSYHTKL